MVCDAVLSSPVQLSDSLHVFIGRFDHLVLGKPDWLSSWVANLMGQLVGTRDAAQQHPGAHWLLVIQRFQVERATSGELAVPTLTLHQQV